MFDLGYPHYELWGLRFLLFPYLTHHYFSIPPGFLLSDSHSHITLRCPGLGFCVALPGPHLWPNQLLGLVFWDRDCCRLYFSLITPTPLLLCLVINSYPCGIHGEPSLPWLCCGPDPTSTKFSALEWKAARPMEQCSIRCGLPLQTWKAPLLWNVSLPVMWFQRCCLLFSAHF